MMVLARDGAPTLAISQPSHAFVAGQMLRAWPDPLPAPLLLAAEQHDLAWLDWECDPAFDAATGLPEVFLKVGAAEHAPLWARAVEQALAAWGRQVALLISRHGSLIYTRFTDRHQGSDADTAAAAAYLAGQAPKQAAWAEQLGLQAAEIERQSGLVALADALSLGLCGGLPLPLEVTGPAPDGKTWRYHLESAATPNAACRLSPWPFGPDHVTIAVDAMPIPRGGFRSEDEMRAWFLAGAREQHQLRIARPS